MMNLSFPHYLNLLQAALISGVSLGAGSALLAEDLLVSDFKDKDAVPPIWEMWGGASMAMAWHQDDAAGDADSGSLKLTIGFDREFDDNQYAIGMALGGKDDWNKDVLASAEKYAKLAFDIRWNNESTAPLDDYNNSGGDPGFYVGLATPSWEKTWLEGPKLADTRWTLKSRQARKISLALSLRNGRRVVVMRRESREPCRSQLTM
jgi:hypothetical protein